jgi:hypothetical protein
MFWWPRSLDSTLVGLVVPLGWHVGIAHSVNGDREFPLLEFAGHVP